MRPARASVLYTGPAVPISYDAAWQTYTNLTKAQIASFQAFPQDLTKYLAHRRWQATVKVITLTTTEADAVKAIQAAYASENTLLLGINAKPPTVTTRAQIDEVIK